MGQGGSASGAARVRCGGRGGLRLALGLLALAAWLALPGPALAAERTFTVASTEEGGDPVPDDGVCSNLYLPRPGGGSRPFGPCTLRAAIDEANATPDRDTIAFAIPGSGVQSIRPTSPLPAIIQPVVIDGYSQPAARPNTQQLGTDAVLLIELDGSGAGSSAVGLDITAITAGGSTVKGLVINRFFYGIRLQTAGDNVVEGNFIGTDAAGTAAPGSDRAVVIDGAPRNVIGGTAVGARNLLSGNLNYGVHIFGAGAEGNRVEGNLLGTNAAGTAPLGNNTGVFINGAPRNVIGGTALGARNVISGNGSYGVYIFGADVEGNRVEGNRIGTDAAGTAPLGNRDGVFIQNAPRNVVGGTVGGAGNTIAFNTRIGVWVGLNASDSRTGNAIQGNAIFANGALGIDLGGDGVTANDPGDGDAGPNNRQNFPILTSAGGGGAATAVAGTLDSTANATFRLEFFASPACDAPSGHGEGRTFLGSAAVTTDGGGRAGFAAGLPVAAVGQVVTATATNTATGDTSEFSACRAVAPVGITVTPTAGLATAEGGGRATFTVALDSVPGADVTIGLSSSNPSEGAVVPESLTFTPANARTPQTVTVTGVDDALVDGDVAYTIVTAPAQSADPAYSGLDAPDVAATNRDDDRLLSVTPQGTGSGTVSSAPAGIACGQDCSEIYPAGTPVALAASPAAGSSFAGWGGACSGSGACLVAMDAAQTVTATFTADASPPGTTPPSGTPNNSPGTIPPAAELPLPTLAIADARRVEGNAGVANLLFTVRLSAPSARPVRVAYATQDLPPGPLAARAGRDYVARRDTLIIPPGRRVDTIAVPIRGDTLLEPDERFRLVLSGPSNATLIRTSALGLILDNDAAPRLYIDDAERAEGQAGRAPLAFTVGLTRPSRAPVTVSFATLNGTARAPGDFAAARGTLTFPPGAVKRTILVPVLGDRVREPDEQVRVALSRASVGLADPVGVGTILNDD